MRKDKPDNFDLGLEETFPAADPVSVSQPPTRLHDQHDKLKRRSVEGEINPCTAIVCMVKDWFPAPIKISNIF